MNVLIADDEALARNRILSLLMEIEPKAKVLAEVGDGLAALEACQQHPIDIALLDIRMPGMNGIDAAIQMSQLEIPPAVIFISAYNEHALAAFDACAIDYLLKPVRAERLSAALSKAKRLSPPQLDEIAHNHSLPDALCVNYRGTLKRIPLDEIIYLHAESKYVEICHQGGFALCESSLKTVEEQYPDYFLRIHRNALANTDYIREIGKDNEGQAVLSLVGADKTLPISRRHLSHVRSLIRS